MERRKPELVKVGGTVVRLYTVCPRKAAPFYQIADYSNGRRKLRSFANPDAARREAERIARLLSTGDAFAARFSPRDAASMGRALELLHETGDSIELAIARYVDAARLLGSGAAIADATKFFIARHKRTTAKPVADVVAELLAVKEARKASPRYVQDLRVRLNKFAEAFRKDTCNVTTAEIQAWLDAQKVGQQSYMNYRRLVHLLFEFAVARGYASDNPVAGVESVKMKGGNMAIFTPSEMARLLAAASPDFLPCLALGAFAGLRSAEIERLEWSEIDLTGRHIIVGADRSKTASRRVVPICNNLAAWLAPYAKRAGKVWTGGHDEFYERPQAIATATGTPNARAVKWKSNALRHSYASYRFAEIGDAGRVAGELGNSATVVHKHYRELVKPADAKRWFAILPEAPANVTPLRKAGS
jgi:integrase